MPYGNSVILIPSHGLEDLPTDLPEPQAESLLNAFALAWHPLLLQTSTEIPRWQQADDPPETVNLHTVFIPTCSEDWIQPDWPETAAKSGATVVRNLSSREEMLAPILAANEGGDTEGGDTGEHLPAPGDAGDFFALGTGYLLLELLTRRMRSFSRLDEHRMHAEAKAAAANWLDGDEAGAKARLAACFEMLLEAREHFYPVDCYLLDLCLVTPETAGEHLPDRLSVGPPLNLLATSETWDSVAEQSPALIDQLRTAVRDEEAEVVGGERLSLPFATMPLDAVVAELHAGHAAFLERFGRPLRVWGRQTYGLGPQLPQILAKLRYDAALHFLLDDGIYPDREESKISWEGLDGTRIDAASRLPLAIESAAATLRFPERMGESMDDDFTAAITLVHWPDVRTPWYEDLCRATRYSHIFGRMVTYSNFFESTDTPGRPESHGAANYRSPALLRGVAARDSDVVSRLAHSWQWWFHRRQVGWADALSSLLARRPAALPGEPDVREWPMDVEAAGDGPMAADAQILEAAQSLLVGPGETPGVFVLNPAATRRSIPIELPAEYTLSTDAAEVLAVQMDNSEETADGGEAGFHGAVVSVPGCGFLWVPLMRVEGQAPVGRTPLAEDHLLRNEHFEVQINAATGGIASLKSYQRGGNRCSTRVAYRFPREKSYVVAEDDSEPRTVCTYYADMRADDVRVLSSGPACGRIASRGKLVDPTNDQPVAEFEHTVTVWRDRTILDIDLRIEPYELPEGDPWSNYCGLRFAWKDSLSAVSQSHDLHVQEAGVERIESPLFVEAASDGVFTTLLTRGHLFHRRTTDNMLDSILVVEGETARSFRLGIAVDEPHAAAAAMDDLLPPLVHLGKAGPDAARTGWLFHVSHPRVVMTGLWPIAGDPAGCLVRLHETEGRDVDLELRCFRTPTRAEHRDFTGKATYTCKIAGDVVRIPMSGHEITDVALLWEPST